MSIPTAATYVLPWVLRTLSSSISGGVNSAKADFCFSKPSSIEPSVLVCFLTNNLGEGTRQASLSGSAAPVLPSPYGGTVAPMAFPTASPWGTAFPARLVQLRLWTIFYMSRFPFARGHVFDTFSSRAAWKATWGCSIIYRFRKLQVRTDADASAEESSAKLGRVVDLHGAWKKFSKLKSVKYFFLHTAMNLWLWEHIFIYNLLLNLAFSGKSEILFLST